MSEIAESLVELATFLMLAGGVAFTLYEMPSLIRLWNYLQDRRVLKIRKGSLRVKRSPMTATHSLTNQLATLFKGSETWLGVFYPRKYIIATFSSFETAVTGKQALRAAGLAQDEICAVSGGEMLHFFREMQVRTGLLGDLMTEFSRFIGTEASFFDRDVWEARHGAGFLAVHCSTEKEADYIRQRLTPLGPVSMQWYRMAAVQSLV